jgi:hypothetical protein
MVDPALHRHGPLAGAAVLAGPDPAGLAAGLRAVLDDPGAARTLAAEAARHAAAHTPAGYAAAMHAVYAQVTARREPCRAGAAPAGRP